MLARGLVMENLTGAENPVTRGVLVFGEINVGGKGYTFGQVCDLASSLDRASIREDPVPGSGTCGQIVFVYPFVREVALRLEIDLGETSIAIGALVTGEHCKRFDEGLVSRVFVDHPSIDIIEVRGVVEVGAASCPREKAELGAGLPVPTMVEVKKRFGEVPTYETVAEVIKQATKKKPRTVGILLFGPHASLLRNEVSKRGLWLDAATGESFTLLTLGDPRHGADEFLGHLDELRIKKEDLLESWNEELGRRGDPDNVERFETFFTTKALGFGPEDLPVLVVFLGDGKGTRLTLPLPRDNALGVGGAAALADLLMKTFSTDAIRGIQAGDNPEDAESLRDTWSAHLKLVERQIQGLPEMPGPQLDPTDCMILEFLRTVEERLVTRQIAERLNLKAESIGKNLSKLGKKGLVTSKQGGVNPGYAVTHSGKTIPIAAP